ncbi:hypothetical protein U1Q18_015010, partial [Sarracenia purpurea var. burkii]
AAIQAVDLAEVAGAAISGKSAIFSDLGKITSSGNCLKCKIPNSGIRGTIVLAKNFYDSGEELFPAAETSGGERRRWFFHRSCRRFRGRRRSVENRRGETAGVEGVSGEEAANSLDRRERETGGGRDADRRSFNGEVAGVIRNHRDGAARGRWKQ